jgi:hypothetical protein
VKKRNLILLFSFSLFLFFIFVFFACKYSFSKTNNDIVNNQVMTTIKDNAIPLQTEVSNIDLSIVKYKDTILNGADPELDDKMIPVVYENNNWVKADIASNWYDYENLKWANVIIVKEDKYFYYKNCDNKTIINNDDILAFFVWIPRFEYQLFNVNNKPIKEQVININFVNKDTPKKINIEDGLYYTHPAFTVNNVELNGFWIAKFEPSLNNNIVQIKPNKNPITNINMADMWNYSISVAKEFGLKSNSRIITNMDWGAIAYLSYSKYGKQGNNEYSGINKNIFVNNVGSIDTWGGEITGCSSGMTMGANTLSCNYGYDKDYYGTGASSTGNIYGIYDLVGGAWECVMGIISNMPVPNNIGGYNGILTDNVSYYDIYEPSNDMYNYARGKIGDATRETLSSSISQKSWNGNLAYFATSSFPWIKRGGTFRGGSYSGLFDYGITDALPRQDKTFRVMISNS